MNATGQRRWWTRRRRAFAWLLAVLALCLFGFVVVYRITVHTITGRAFEDDALRGAAWGARQGADSFTGVLDIITVTSIMATLAVIALIALIRMRRTQGLAAIALLIAANISSQLLKSYILPRPDLGLDESAPATLNSLPSGHMTAAFAIGAALLFVLPPALRTVAALATVGGSAVVAVATMATGWHRPGDSAASFLLVTAWAAAIGLVLLLVDPTGGARPVGSAPDSLIRRLLGFGGMVVGLPAALAVAGVAAVPAIREAATAPALAFLTSSGLLTAVAAVCTALVLGVVARTEPSPKTRSAAGREAAGSVPAPQADAGDSPDHIEQPTRVELRDPPGRLQPRDSGS